MTTPVIEDAAGKEATGAPPATPADELAPATQSMPRPFRLNLLGIGAAIALFTRLGAANDYGDLSGTPTLLLLALSNVMVGASLLLIATERDRVGHPVLWISVVTAASWAALNWVSPPFADNVTAFDTASQLPLAAVGAGNGLLLAGVVTLAFVRRAPTMTVATALLASVVILSTTTVFLRVEWPAIGVVGLAFILWLFAWDRSPRREHSFELPEFSPRFSRSALSLISVVLCGTALQLWISRSAIPRALPAVILAGALVIAAFATMWRVRREIEKRETMLGEWRDWMREIRSGDFHTEIRGFESEQPRQLSFPDLLPTADDLSTGPAAPTEPTEPDSAIHGDALIEVPTVDTPPLDTPPRDAPVLDPVAEYTAALDTAALDTAASLRAPKIDLPPSDVPSIDVPATATSDPDPAVSAHTPEPGTTPLSIELPDSAAEPPASLPGLIPDLAPAASIPPLITIPDVDELAAAAASEQIDPPLVGGAVSSGAFSAMVATPDAEPVASMASFATLDALDTWLTAPRAGKRQSPLLVAMEVMALEEYDSLPERDAADATEQIGAYLADRLPANDIIAWIDGPYFIAAYSQFPASQVPELNTTVSNALKATDGVLAFVRPRIDAQLDDLVQQAVLGLLHARRNQQLTARR